MVVLIVVEMILFLSALSFVVLSPLMLGVLLVVNSMLLCAVVGFIYSSLLGLIIFLSYVGGVMVVFSYVLSVYPNDYQYVKWFKIDVQDFLFVLFVTGIISWYMWAPMSPNSKVLFSFIGFGNSCVLYLTMSVVLLYVLMVVCFLCNKTRYALRKLI